MVKRLSRKELLGSWAFLIGVILAIILGAGFAGRFDATITWILVVIGVLVGLLNVANKEVQPFLISGLVLIIDSSLTANLVVSIPSAGPILASTLASLIIVFAPATIIVALKNVFSITKN